MALKQADHPAKLSFYIRARERGKPDNLDRLHIDEGTCRVQQGPQGWTVRGYTTQDALQSITRRLDDATGRISALCSENNDLATQLETARENRFAVLLAGAVAGVLCWELGQFLWGWVR